ncbi:toxin [Pseudomonas agarici]|uniref:Toxin n=1 Tax=Pseudomonas agarici TaxID=46677 RepID=A0A0X1SX21_PSEAA|nr:SpvB/TcaC N-terminal domain-containing protein [Pseudomonas agarici]AMB84426.1 toxin [Pseudomonas agarici]
MDHQQPLTITPPSLPKGGGAIHSIGKGWGSVGALGGASFDIALPISAGRGFAPSLALVYSSLAGNSEFGLGWSVPLGHVARRTSKGVPRYDEEDAIVGPGEVEWLPERHADGTVRRDRVSHYQDRDLARTYEVTRHFPRVEGAFDLIEHWRVGVTDPGFWLVHGADGSLHLYGKRTQAQVGAPPGGVAQWLLEESVSAHGEHILYEYRAEDASGLMSGIPPDPTAWRYLSRVRYGNPSAYSGLYLWEESTLPTDWHFDLLFDYGERPYGLTDKPGYEAVQPWPLREDPCASFAFGFELSTLRLCRQVLMFHHFPATLGDAPCLVRRLLLEHRPTALGYSQLVAAHDQAYDAAGSLRDWPPLEFDYAGFDLGESRYRPFDALPGLNDDQGYQLVDLYGEGLPGMLYRSDKAWYYREPLRAQPAAHADDVAYGEWCEVPQLPLADSAASVRQSLTDLTGDGRLDWLVCAPAMSGFFTLNPDRSWSSFASFAAFPQEFFHPQGQMADLIGAGLSDLALIGPRSVRLYANRREQGFAGACEVERLAPDDALPLPGESDTELVAFSDVLGSGQQHLVRIRHDEVKCWPNLGHGRFGNGRRLATLPYTYEAFEAARIRLADLDGSGATDILYLTSEHIEIFMNRGGNAFETTAYKLPWPPGVRYDRLCQVSVADLQGLGCSSLVLTVPHMSPRHWRCDFVHAKPYLLTTTNNNMGAAGTVSYRASAQEWLDEKQALQAEARAVECLLPLSMHLVSRQEQRDEISGNRLTQHFSYRQGFYDGRARKFRGFGLLLQTDAESTDAEALTEGYTAPVLSKTWFHTGRFPDMPQEGYDRSDTEAHPLGKTLLSHFDEPIGRDVIVEPDSPDTLSEMANALVGMPLRIEIFGLDDSRLVSLPYCVQQWRYLVRQLRPACEQQPMAVMLPLELESISYQYERQPDDPVCQHRIHLARDAYGGSTRELTVHYARRKRATDPPPCADPHEGDWWRAAHDAQQAYYYLDEIRRRAIHLSDRQGWRLGLPYQSRHNVLVLESRRLTPADLGYERCLDPEGLIDSAPDWALGSLSLQRYQKPLSAGLEPDGQANFLALPGELEVAELDETALQAYERVLERPALEAELTHLGYRRMPVFLPDDPVPVLWSVRKGFVAYAGAEGFYKVLSVKATAGQSATQVIYDPYYCLPISVTRSADGCTTEAVNDYRFLRPVRVIDPNLNVQEAVYGPYGELQATSFQGTERGEPVGFAPLDDYRRPFESPEQALNDPQSALQDAASALFQDPCSWMGRLDPHTHEAFARRVSQGDLLPSGHIRCSARWRLAAAPSNEVVDSTWASAVREARREPVHALTLQADRYPGDLQRQIRVSGTSWDGFGRVLQTRQKVEPGDAYQVDEQGALVLEDGRPVIVEAAERWRVSERVEYNNKGLAIRTYRPYFVDRQRYINDASFRQFGYCDQQYYDPLGRPTLTVTARQQWRRQRYLGWYGISEDENDLHEEAMAAKVHQPGGDER